MRPMKRVTKAQAADILRAGGRIAAQYPTSTGIPAWYEYEMGCAGIYAQRMAYRPDFDGCNAYGEQFRCNDDPARALGGAVGSRWYVSEEPVGGGSNE